MGEDNLSKPISESLNPDPLSVSHEESDGNKLAPESGAEPVLNCVMLKDQVKHPLKPEPEELGAECEIELKKEQKIVTESKTNTELLNDPSINESKNGSPDYEIKNPIIPKSTKKRVRYEPPTPDSVAGRLRQRRGNKAMQVGPPQQAVLL